MAGEEDFMGIVIQEIADFYASQPHTRPNLQTTTNQPTQIDFIDQAFEKNHVDTEQIFETVVNDTLTQIDVGKELIKEKVVDAVAGNVTTAVQESKLIDDKFEHVKEISLDKLKVSEVEVLMLK